MPKDLAASTNSLSFTAKTSPLTILAIGIQLVRPIADTINIKIPVSGPKSPLRVSRNSIIITKRRGRRGKARNRSVNRISGPSNLLKKPDITPISVPNKTQSAIAVTPTSNDTRPPANKFENVSLPS